MTTINDAYITTAWQGALADFDQAAGPGHINDPFRDLACRLLELAHVSGSPYSEADAEHEACSRARQLGHAESNIQATWRWAERHMQGKAAVVPAPAYTNGASHAPGGFANLAAYAASRGVPAEVFKQAGWSDSELYEFSYTDKQGRQQIGHADQERLVYDRIRRAIRFETDAGPRWRLIDEAKPAPKYWHPAKSHLDSNKTWYRLSEALVLAAQHGYLALVNGEASVVVAQHHAVPALCETGGGEKLTPPQLLQVLRVACPDVIILIALDCDQKGRSAALKKAAQYRAAGFAVRAIDLGLGTAEDIADFCRLYGQQARAQLLLCADIPEPQTASAAPAQPRTQSQVTIDRLRRLGYEFRLNLCGNQIEVNGEPITDQISAVIRTKLRDEGVKGLGAVEDAYTAHAVEHAYHPVRDYLNSLAWDGHNRIAELAICIVGENPDVTYQNGAICPLASVYLHRWLIGAVAKALASEQNAMLVFTGPQGLGKSHLARWLCPPRLADRHYLEADINTRDKDSYVRLMQMFIWEVGELDRTTRKQDVAELKQFISEKVVTVRRSYGRYDTRGPALASLIGTVNGQEFLADDTGNRRFFVLDVQRLDWAYQDINVDQLWAEAVARYRAGEPWRLTSEEVGVQTEHNRGFLADSIVGDYIRKHFFVTGDSDHTMTAADILDTLRVKDVRLTGTERALSMEISRAMAALGVPRARAAGGRGARVYVGITPK